MEEQHTNNIKKHLTNMGLSLKEKDKKCMTENVIKEDISEEEEITIKFPFTGLQTNVNIDL